MAEKETRLFTKVANKAIDAGIAYQQNHVQAMQWFRNMARTFQNVKFEQIEGEAGPFERVQKLSPNSIGKMYIFTYDAKHKDELRYWDSYPLIYPIEFYPSTGRMLGINLHYLNPFRRAQLMNQLWTTANNENYDKTTKLKINYQILKAASQFAAFKPCIHMYLFDHVKTPFISINPKMWDFTLFLPLQKFNKANEHQVWADSELIFRGRKPNRPKKRK